MLGTLEGQGDCALVLRATPALLLCRSPGIDLMGQLRVEVLFNAEEMEDIVCSQECRKIGSIDTWHA